MHVTKSKIVWSMDQKLALKFKKYWCSIFIQFFNDFFVIIKKKDSIESRRERKKTNWLRFRKLFSPSSALASQNFSLFSLIFSHFHPFDLLCFELANNSYSLLLLENVAWIYFCWKSNSKSSWQGKHFVKFISIGNIGTRDKHFIMEKVDCKSLPRRLIFFNNKLKNSQFISHADIINL